jgi:uncharacterized metal-binding protein
MSEPKDVCCNNQVKTLILGCSGGSNVGQIANNAMIELDKSGVGNAYCLAGVGAALSGFIESVKSSRTIVIDGCPVGCAKKAFEKYDLTPSLYFVVTEIGIEKKHAFDMLGHETDRALDHIKSHL